MRTAESVSLLIQTALINLAIYAVPTSYSTFFNNPISPYFVGTTSPPEYFNT